MKLGYSWEFGRIAGYLHAQTPIDSSSRQATEPTQQLEIHTSHILPPLLDTAS